MNTFDSSSTASSETTEDRERAREWTELMILEERKQRLQKSRESERYTEALKARLKEKLITKDSALLPLCSCGMLIPPHVPTTVPSTETPKVFEMYRNVAISCVAFIPVAFEKAFTSQLKFS